MCLRQSSHLTNSIMPEMLMKFQTLVAAVLITSVITSGCSLTPYVRTKGLETSLPAPASITPGRFAGDLEAAINDVDAQRTSYLNELVERTRNRNILSGALIVLSASALYHGITAETGSASRAVANLGVAAGGAYALGSYSDSPNTELTYIRAGNDLTCLVLRTRPWLMKTGDYNVFFWKVHALQHRIDQLDAMHQKQFAQSDNRKAFLKDTRFHQKTQRNARLTLRKASNLMGYIDSAGFQLRQQALLVSNTANLEIHRLQPALATPSALVVGMRATSQAFRDIKPLDVPDSDDQKKLEDSDDDAGESPDTTTKAGGKTDSTSPAAPAGKTETSDLAKAAGELVKQIAAIESELAAHKKATKKETTKSRDDMNAMKKEIASLQTQLKNHQASPTHAPSGESSITKPDDRVNAVELAHALSNLFSAMRPVNAVLSKTYSLKSYVRDIPECRSPNAPPFKFTLDAGEIELNPGQTFEVGVVGGIGIPQIWMSGAIGNDKDGMPKFTTLIEGGLVRARLTLTPSTPPSEISILAVDGSGKQFDEIKVIVKAAKK